MKFAFVVVVVVAVAIGLDNALSSPVEVGHIDSWQPLQQGFSMPGADPMFSRQQQQQQQGTRPSAPSTAFPPGVSAKSLHSRPWSSEEYSSSPASEVSEHRERARRRRYGLLSEQQMLQLNHRGGNQQNGMKEQPAPPAEDYSIGGPLNPADMSSDSSSLPSFLHSSGNAPPQSQEQQRDSAAAEATSPKLIQSSSSSSSSAPSRNAWQQQQQEQQDQRPGVLYRRPSLPDAQQFQQQQPQQFQQQVAQPQGMVPQTADQAQNLVQPQSPTVATGFTTPLQQQQPQPQSSYDVHLYDANMLRALMLASHAQFRASQAAAMLPGQQAMSSFVSQSTLPSQTGMLPSAYPQPVSGGGRGGMFGGNGMNNMNNMNSMNMMMPSNPPPPPATHGFPLMHPFGSAPTPQTFDFGASPQYPPRMPNGISSPSMEFEDRAGVF